ncbi:MAG: hypothetical protein ACYTHJ_18235 [Planctomycetota bacterium]|jgi:hypothetical protein
MELLLAEGSALEGVKGFINAACEPAPFLIISIVGLAVFLLGYRTLTKPKVALPIGIAATAFFVASCFDSDFLKIVTKADNVPIVMMMFLVAFVTWLAFRQAAINDERMEKGEPLLEAGSDVKVLVWPDLVYTELICLVLCTAALTVWAILLRAPLEQPADPNVAPNPAKAPWYFLGLQEMLVYFDPWLAGVVYPGLIIVGLIAIPYIDKNPLGNGYYTFKQRWFAISTFMVGWIILWVVLIIFGTFLRGPNWNFFGPYEYWDHHRPAALLNTEFHDLFWVGFMGQALPENYLLRELPGIVLVIGYFVVGWGALQMLFLRKIYLQIGFIRFSVLAFLILMMLSMPIKMVLRWTLNLHYVVGITEWFLNI